MRETPPSGPVTARSGIVASALVHVFTATGVVCALFAVLATLEGSWTTAFVWLGIAFIIDGIDGTFARYAQVAHKLPRFSGERLDMIVDYTTYVFVPALMLLESGILSGAIGIVAAALILMSSLFHFIDTESKTEDNYFVGFPAIWNLVAFYLFAFSTPSWVALAVIIVCAGLTFVPMRWLHPMRVRRWFVLNAIATLAWAVAACWTVFVSGFPADTPALIVLGAVAIYGIGLAFSLPWAIESGSHS